MERDAPRPRHEAIRRGREMARAERRTGRAEALGLLVRHAPFCIVALVLAFRAWRSGGSWLGPAIVGAGWLGVAAWGLWRELRDQGRAEARRRRRLELRHESRAARPEAGVTAAGASPRSR